MRPYFKKECSVTTDNYFTSLKLAEKLKAEKTTLLGTIIKHRKEVPNVHAMMKAQSLHLTRVYISPIHETLTIDKAKKNKLECLLSLMHKTVSVDQAHKKKPRETVKYYNWSKVGVNVLDQMARYHTCKSATRRWPVAIFFNTIDSVRVNAYIVYLEVTNQSMSRREFLLLLIKVMCGESLAERIPAFPSASTATSEASRESRKTKQCQPQQCRNKSTLTCHHLSSPSSFRPPFSRPPAPSTTRQELVDGLCYYHRKYPSAARHRVPGCSRYDEHLRKAFLPPVPSSQASFHY